MALLDVAASVVLVPVVVVMALALLVVRGV